jgi:hypothetical protein
MALIEMDEQFWAAMRREHFGMEWDEPERRRGQGSEPALAFSSSTPLPSLGAALAFGGYALPTLRECHHRGLAGRLADSNTFRPSRASVLPMVLSLP